jgi:3-carboxy-cis,cis-muconate cycloisomerase
MNEPVDDVASTPEATAATGPSAWLIAMLDVERAMAEAAGQVGLIPAGSAQAVARACRPESYDLAELAASAATSATPVIALVRRLRALVPEDARQHVHLAATSQDVVDSAAVLVARRTLAGVMADVDEVGDLLAGLADRHRDTRQVGRTLLQDAMITTFGAACAARLAGVDEAAAALESVSRKRLAVQLGGPVGTLAGTGDRAIAYLEAVAGLLDLPVPVTAWHTTRGRIGALAGACAVLAGELGGVAEDVVLLSQTGIGEVRVAAPGGSSSMPHKQNPASAVLALACVHRIPGPAGSLIAGMPQGLHRSAGAWQAEQGSLSELLRLLAGAARHTRRALTGLHIDVAAMEAHVNALTGTGVTGDTGAAATFVDRALAAHRSRTDTASQAASTSAAGMPTTTARS